MSSARRMVGLVLMAVATGALVSCGSSSVTTGAGRSTTTTTASSTAPTAPGAPSACRASQLGANRLAAGAAAGHVVVTYGLRNTSASPCTLLGYPGVQMVDGSGRALPTQVSHGGSFAFAAEAPTVVVLPPGAQASFYLAYSDVPAGGETSCAQSARLELTPPGDTGTLVVDDAISPCGNGAVTVSPVHSGTAPPP